MYCRFNVEVLDELFLAAVEGPTVLGDPSCVVGCSIGGCSTGSGPWVPAGLVETTLSDNNSVLLHANTIGKPIISV